MSKKHFGKCQLTGRSDRFVECHLIPKALTRPERPGIPFTQGGKGLRPVRRWSSWTDTRLVVREGEDILRDLDTWAIQVLRSNHLVWSGWNGSNQLPVPQTIFDSEKRGVRRIDGIDSKKLRLFILSLLWRAAASNISEMSEINLNTDDVNRLRFTITTGVLDDISFYPAQLIQLLTKGPAHNLSPVAQIKSIPSLQDGVEILRIPIFRFYLEGLIIHIHRHSEDNGYTQSLGELVVGAGEAVFVTTVPYEISFQAENLRRAWKKQRRSSQS